MSEQTESTSAVIQNSDLLASAVQAERQEQEARRPRIGRPPGAKTKNPVFVENMRKLNAAGKRGIGGRRPTHGRHALAELLKRGLENEHGGDPLAQLHKEMVQEYVGDLGGPDNVSAMDLGIVKRLVACDLDMGLLLAMRDAAKKISRLKMFALSAAVNKNAATYCQLVKTLGGPGRRAADTPGEIIVRRFAEHRQEPEREAAQ